MSKQSKRILIVATVVKLHIMHFHISTLKLFKEMGWETAVAARNDYNNPEDCQIPYCDQFYDIPFERIPFMPKNVLSGIFSFCLRHDIVYSKQP